MHAPCVDLDFNQRVTIRRCVLVVGAGSGVCYVVLCWSRGAYSRRNMLSSPKMFQYLHKFGSAKLWWDVCAGEDCCCTLLPCRMLVEEWRVMTLYSTYDAVQHLNP